MPEENKEEKAIHPLLSREIRSIRNWHEWHARWEAAKVYEELESLLHFGFSVRLHGSYGEPEYDDADRIIFYLRVADGWVDPRRLLCLVTDRARMYQSADSNDETMNLRQKLAHKAFDMLCLNFFKADLYDDHGTEKLFPLIQDFFQAEFDYRDSITIRNLSRFERSSHNEQLAVDFLVKLATFIWEQNSKVIWYGENIEDRKRLEAEKQARLDSAKPWMVMILVKLERFDLLRKWIFKMDRACFNMLEAVAFRRGLDSYQHKVEKCRQVKTLDEAVYAGSKAGMFLIECQIKLKVEKNLKEIREAREAKKEAEQKLKKLVSK